MRRYSFVQRLLHWLIVLMVIGTLAAGITLGVQDFNGTVETFGKATTNMLYKYHKSFGILILGAMVLRLIARLAWGKPSYGGEIGWLARIASALVHLLLYLALFAMPVLGWLATGAGGFPVEFFDWNLPGMIGKDKELSTALFELHGLVGLVLLALVVLHVAAALRHALVLRDGVTRRMRLF